MRRILMFALVFLFVVVGCSRQDADEVGDDDSTNQIEPTPTETASPTPESTATPERTPTPTPESTPTPEPTPTPTPEPERATLTGEPVSERQPRPIAVRIDNSLEARPQSGLAQADLVYESPTEASITRYLAFFQTSAPEVVGPVRSARLMDVRVLPLHDAILAYSGASIGVQNRLVEYGLPLLHLEGNAGAASWRDGSRFAPHNLYTSIPALRDIASQNGWMREAENVPFSYDDPPVEGVSGAGVNIPYAAGFVQYRYNAETDSYDRMIEGVEARDRETNELVSPRNVVVMWANFFTGNIAPNTRGEISNDVELSGAGSAWVFRNGQRYDVEWRREDPGQPFRFYERETGEEIPLATGKTWINLVPLDMAPEAVE